MPNDFSGDASCQALWRFESGALPTDSKGSNTLTNNGATEDLVNYREGACAAKFTAASSQYMNIADASLGAGFPLKNGDSVKTGTYSFWYRPVSDPGYFGHVVINKSNNYGISVGINTAVLYIYWGYGTSYEGISLAVPWTWTVGHWYHISVVFDGVNKKLAIYGLEVSSGIFYSGQCNPVNSLSVSNYAFEIGRRADAARYVDGQLDEFVVFNRCLTPDECYRISQGTYAGAVNTVPVYQEAVQLEYDVSPAIKVQQVLAQIETATPTQSLYAFQLAAQIEYVPSLAIEAEAGLTSLGLVSPAASGSVIIKRIFPVPPEARILQSQCRKRIFPIVK